MLQPLLNISDQLVFKDRQRLENCHAHSSEFLILQMSRIYFQVDFSYGLLFVKIEVRNVGYSFDEVEELKPDTPYLLEIELWDAAIVIPQGHSLLLEIGSQNQSGCGLTIQTADDRAWDADVTVHTGGEFDSHLLLPIIPASTK